jgi:hypothetical protein
LGSNTRSKIRRFLRKVDNSEEFRITHASSDTINKDLDVLFRLWESTWSKRRGECLDNVINTQRAMMMHCFKSGRLFLPILWKQGAPLGALASVVDRKKKSLLFFLAGRDETVSSPPPGFVLHAHSIRYAINKGFRCYDFLRGNESYKYLFKPQERKIRYLIVTARDRPSLTNKVDWGSFNLSCGT